MIADIITDKVSLIGQLHHTPQIGAMPQDWNNRGKHIMSGMRKRTWRVRLRKIALDAIPTEV
jgi:hypothetical protein